MHTLLWEITTKPSISQKGTWRFQERYDFHTPAMLAVGFCSHSQRFLQRYVHASDFDQNRMHFE